MGGGGRRSRGLPRTTHDEGRQAGRQEASGTSDLDEDGQRTGREDVIGVGQMQRGGVGWKGEGADGEGTIYMKLLITILPLVIDG